MLTLTLRNLERDGLLRRTVYPTVPPKVEYERTDTARELHQSPLSLLEPVVEVTVTVPEDAVGAVLGDLAARPGHRVGDAGGRVGRHRDRVAGRTVRLRHPVAQPHAGPRRLHGPPHRLRAGAGVGDGVGAWSGLSGGSA
jgi:hypothetical protein